MNRANTAPPEILTAADFRERLGGIPIHRIRLPLGTATEADLIAVQRKKESLFELVDDTIVEKAVGCREATVTAQLCCAVGSYLDRNDLGFSVGPDCLFRLTRGRVRSPSLAFIAWAKLSGGRIPNDPITDLVPDLVAEIVREDNTPAEFRRKVGEYLDAGVRLAWVIDPRKRTARVHPSAGRSILIREEEALDGGDVLPGFSVRLAGLFKHFDAL